VSNSLQSIAGVKAVDRESIHKFNLEQSLAQTQAILAQEKGATGAGCGVAVLDSGIDDRHCMFGGKLTNGSACFGTDFVIGQFSGFDYGYRSLCARGETSLTDATLANTYEQVQFFPDHGTHVAGIAAGASCTVLDLEQPFPTFDETPGGVASGAHIIPVNVFSDFYWDLLGDLSDPANSGTLDDAGAFTGDIIAGLEWVLLNRNSLDVCAVNMSLGGGADVATPCADATEMVIDMLTDAGIAVVIATGNGSSRAGVRSPACVESAIAVGAVDDAGDLAGFSDHLDAMVDLVAPGVGINSATSDFTTIARPTVSYTWNSSGTSMATPHVAGAFAILKARYPQASVAQLLNALQITGAEVPGFETPSIRVFDACRHLDLVVFPIPTMSEWGLMIFGLLIMNMSVFFVRRKNEILA